MDYLQKLVSQVRRYLFAIVALQNIALIGGWWLLDQHYRLDPLITIGILGMFAFVSVILIAIHSANVVMQPVTALWQTILHLAPGYHGVIPPKIEALQIGRELVNALSAEIYRLTTQAEHLGELRQPGLSHPVTESIIKSLPVPLIALDKTRNIIFLNEAAAVYIGQKADELIGKNFYSTFNLSFSTETTLDHWLGEVGQNKALADNSWDRVRVKVGESVKQFDLVAHYSRENPTGTEVTLAFFDHTNRYNEDDQGISFVALSVHELRTPLTLLRGYIEVFEDEMQGKLTPELQDFMYKMNAAAQQLAAFVSNILNVARVENDQLVLTLHEEDWSRVLAGALENLRLRAQVRGIQLTCQVDPGLPTVGVDRVSIFEVLNNLIDNAIKYSSGSNRINIHARWTQDGFVETTVQDWGIGISESAVPNLFSKYYRNFRSSQIGGTGLGLFLCKAIVTAHGGNIWVRSKEGEGSTFGFTLLPYNRLADDQKNGDNKEIVRGAHSWIKNHSLYRK
jgi:signal transduction histidine kinase